MQVKPFNIYWIPIIFGFQFRFCICYSSYYGDTSKCPNLLTVVISTEPDLETRSLINEVQVNSVEECAEVCVKDSIKCTHFNFFRETPTSNPICTLMGESSGLIAYQRDPVNLPIMYTGQVLCLPSKQAYCDRPWSFEKIGGLAVINEDYVIRSLLQTNVESCLTACLETSDCYSIQMQSITGTCRLLSVSTNTVRDMQEFFIIDKGWTLYENNCHFVSMTPQSCQFIHQRRSGMLTVFDTMMKDVYTASACKLLCMQWEAATCRSYTFDARSSVCYLSHSTMRGLKKMLNARKIQYDLKTAGEFLEMGDLEDCIDLELKCQQDSMLVKGHSMKMFSGQLKARNDASPDCSKSIQKSYNFQTNVPYDGCGTKQSGGDTYVNVVFLKDGATELITIRDKLVQLICRIYMDDLSVTYNMDVYPNPKRLLSNDPLIISPDMPTKLQPRFKLEIYDKDFKPAEVVTNGEQGFLEIRFDQHSGQNIDLQVTDLVATDIHSNHKIVLFDENGCPTDRRYAGVLRNVGGGKMRAPISFFGFSDSSTIYYRGLAKPCIGNCHINCDKLQDVSRRRRSMTKAGESNSMLLTDERYRISSINSVRFSNNQSSLIDDRQSNSSEEAHTFVPNHFISVSEVKEYGITEKDSNVLIEKFVKEPTVLCFSQDPNCFVTVLLAFLQALLLILIGFILYVYCKQSNNYSKMRDGVARLKNSLKTKSIAIYTVLNDSRLRQKTEKNDDIESTSS